MFDLETHKKDRHGKIVSEQPYRLLIVNGEARYERPLGSGMWFSGDGVLLEKPAEKPAEKPEEALVVEANAKQGIVKAR